MSHLPLQPLQAAMLFENPSQFASQFPHWQEVLATLNASLPEGTPQFEILPGGTGGQVATLSNQVMHITIERMDAPLAIDGFAPVLAQPYYAKMKPELVDGVKAHRCAILFNVGLGAFPFPLEHELISSLGMAEQLGGDQDQEKFELRLLLAQLATLAFYKHFTPTVVHWGQSDQLFDGAAYETLARTGFALPLYVHPGFSGSGKKVKGSFCTGVNAYGTEHLLGKHVEFAEHPQAMAVSYAMVLSFVAYCRNLGHIIEDGGTFSLGDDGDVVEVHHMPASQAHANGHIELRLRDGATGRGMKVKVRPSAKGVMEAFMGKRNALSGKDAPDTRAAMSRKTGILGAVLRGLVTKAVGIAVIVGLLGLGPTILQSQKLADLTDGFVGSKMVVLSRPMAAMPNKSAPAKPAPQVRNNLQGAARTAPALFQPSLPDDL